MAVKLRSLGVFNLLLCYTARATIHRLLALLARERRKIINRLQEKQEKLVLAMKRDLQNEIKQGILDYKV